MDTVTATHDAPLVEIPPTAWAALGVLSFGGEFSGYDVKRWAEQSLAFFYWAPSHSQIYAELRRLEALGLAESRIDTTYEARARRLYTITDLGRENITRWADELPPEPVVLKHPLMLRVWAAHNGKKGRLRELLLEHKHDALDRAARAQEHAANSAKVSEWAYATVALEWSVRYHRDEAARIDWLLERLDAAGVASKSRDA